MEVSDSSVGLKHIDASGDHAFQITAAYCDLNGGIMRQVISGNCPAFPEEVSLGLLMYSSFSGSQWKNP